MENENKVVSLFLGLGLIALTLLVGVILFLGERESADCRHYKDGAKRKMEALERGYNEKDAHLLRLYRQHAAIYCRR